MSQISKDRATVIFWEYRWDHRKPVTFVYGSLDVDLNTATSSIDDHVEVRIPYQWLRHNNDQLILEGVNAELKRLHYPKRIFCVSNCSCLWGMHWRELTAEERIEEILEPAIEITI